MRPRGIPTLSFAGQRASSLKFWSIDVSKAAMLYACYTDGMRAGRLGMCSIGVSSAVRKAAARGILGAEGHWYYGFVVGLRG